MIRQTYAIALFAAMLSPVGVIAQTAPAAAPAAPAYTVADTDIGTLLDDPAAKAVLDKNIPGFSANPQIDMARSMTLKAVQAYAADKLTDEALAKVDADLAKLPVKK
jgi:para-nitrobenzyl esterase